MLQHVFNISRITNMPPVHSFVAVMSKIERNEINNIIYSPSFSLNNQRDDVTDLIYLVSLFSVEELRWF